MLAQPCTSLNADSIRVDLATFCARFRSGEPLGVSHRCRLHRCSSTTVRLFHFLLPFILLLRAPHLLVLTHWLLTLAAQEQHLRELRPITASRRSGSVIAAIVELVLALASPSTPLLPGGLW